MTYRNNRVSLNVVKMHAVNGHGDKDVFFTCDNLQNSAYLHLRGIL